MIIISNKKAAMFGLDARIALAIFAALSVITGAALYKAIRHARIVAFATEITEMAKAIEQYTLDTGSGLPVSLANAQFKEIYELTSSSARGWKGPYFNFNPHSGEGTYYARHKNQVGTVSSVMIQHRKNYTGPCTDVKDCDVFVTMNFIPNDQALAIKEYFDNTTDLAHKGRIMVSTQNVDEKVIVYKVMPALSL